MLRTLICHKETVREKMGYAQMEVGFKEESSGRNRVQCSERPVKAANRGRGIQEEKRGSPVELKRV